MEIILNNHIKRLKHEISISGYVLTFIENLLVLINKAYSILVMSRRNVRISYSSKIRGRKFITIGKNFFSGQYLWIEAVEKNGINTYSPRIVIKDNVSINDFVHIAATNYIEIGENVLIASKVYISDHNHGYYSGDMQSSPFEAPNNRVVSCNQKIIIGNNVWIGEGVAILPGAEIEEGCIIGANSAVTKKIPKFSIAVGAPAKVIKKYDFESEKWIPVDEI